MGLGANATTRYNKGEGYNKKKMTPRAGIEGLPASGTEVLVFTTAARFLVAASSVRSTALSRL